MIMPTHPPIRARDPTQPEPVRTPNTDIVVQRGLGDPQKSGELLPVVEQVLNGLADPGAGLDELLLSLPFAPALELLHDGAAFFLVEPQALIGIELALPGQIVVMVDFGEAFDHMPALLGEVVHDIDEVPAGVGEAVGDNRLKGAGHIAAEGIAHLDGSRKGLGSGLEDL